MGQHTAHLETFYDGAIPDHLRAWARRQDDLDARAAKHEYIPPTPHPAIPRPARLVVAPMARFITDRVAADDSCTEAQLLAAGFTLGEIALHGEAARRVAGAVLADRVAA